MLTVLWLVAVLLVVLALSYINASGIAWSAAAAGAIALAWATQALPNALSIAFSIFFVLLAIPFNVPVLRRKLISDPVLAAFRKVMPPMSQTEREAIEAGTVWWDGELFSGRPQWHNLLDSPVPALTPDEQYFLNHDAVVIMALVTVRTS